MQDINITYSNYIIIDDERKAEIDFQLNYCDLEVKDYFSDLDLEKYNFGFVKELQTLFIENRLEELYERLSSLDCYSEEKLLDAPCWQVLLTFKFLIEKIANTLDIEKSMLTSSSHGDDYSALIEQVDFSMFDNEYTQIRELAEGDIRRFDEIRALPYETCIVELIYRQKQSDLNALVMKTKKN